MIPQTLESLYTKLETGYDHPGSNTAAGVDIPAVTGKIPCIRQVDLSVRGTWTNPPLTVSAVINGETIWNSSLPTDVSDVYHFEFPWGLYSGQTNNTLDEVVGVAASVTTSQPTGGTCDLKLNVFWEYV